MGGRGRVKSWPNFLITSDEEISDRRARVTWIQLRTPDAPRRARVTWVQFRIPEFTSDRRARVTWVQLRVPDRPVLDSYRMLREWPRTVTFRYDLLDGFGTPKGTLDTVRSGSVKYDSLAEIKRTATFDVAEPAEVNWLVDRIKPYMVLNDEFEWPLGVFLPTSPERSTTGAGVTRRVEAYDQLVILRDETIEDRLIVPATSNAVAEVERLLAESPIADPFIETSPLTLETTLEWEPGTSKLRVINDLLTAVNYQTLWFDADGIAQVRSYLFPLARPVLHTYETNEESLVAPDASHILDLFNVPNKWIVYRSDPEGFGRAERINANPDSPTSTLSRLRTITKVARVDSADTYLDGVVERMAIEDSQVYEDVTIRTALMPEHGDSDLTMVTHSELGVSALFIEVSWDMDLKNGALMNHRLRRIVQI